MPKHQRLFWETLIVFVTDCLFVAFVVLFYSLIHRDKELLEHFTLSMTIIVLSPLSTLGYVIVRSKKFCLGMQIYHALVVLAFVGFIVMAFYLPKPTLDYSDRTNAFQIFIIPIHYFLQAIYLLYGLFGFIVSLFSFFMTHRIYFKFIISELKDGMNDHTKEREKMLPDVSIDETAASFAERMKSEQSCSQTPDHLSSSSGGKPPRKQNP